MDFICLFFRALYTYVQESRPISQFYAFFFMVYQKKFKNGDKPQKSPIFWISAQVYTLSLYKQLIFWEPRLRFANKLSNFYRNIWYRVDIC